MRTINIGNNPNDPLAQIAVGRSSAFVARLVGVPSDVENVEVHFGTRNDLSINPCVCRKVPGGEWKCYANGFFFPDEGKAHYHVTAKTAAGDSVYFGKGKLIIMPSVINVKPGAVGIVPDETYVRNPKTGLWHKVIAELDENGEIVMATEQEGITK